MLKAIDTILELSNAGFRPLSEAKPRHFAAIGRFIIAVSNEIDVRLNECLQGQIEASDDAVTRIVVGEMRTGDVMAAIKRIIHSRSPDSKLCTELEELFKEINTLRQNRDIVAHRICQVSRNRLAFHNASLAKTDAAIEVTIFSIREIDEFVEYAKRLGFRIIALQAKLIPAYLSPAKQAYLTLALHDLHQQAIVELIKIGKIKGNKAIEIRTINRTAHEAINAYVASARRVDVEFGDLQKAARSALSNLFAALTSLDAPDVPALHEIPSRLRKTDRNLQKGTAQPRPRPRRPSRS